MRALYDGTSFAEAFTKKQFMTRRLFKQAVLMRLEQLSYSKRALA